MECQRTSKRMNSQQSGRFLEGDEEQSKKMVRFRKIKKIEEKRERPIEYHHSCGLNQVEELGEA